MKVDVIVTPPATDDSKLRSRPTDESKTARLLVRSRLAEQIEAEEVLLSNDIESRLQYRAKPGDAHPAAKMARGGVSGDEIFDWTSTSDEDVAPGIEVPRITVNVKRSVTGFFARPAVSSTPPSPPVDDPEKNLEAASPMETDISSFFPAARGHPGSRKEGLSPRQRLLYRYQMEKMVMMMNESNEDRELPDGSAGSGTFRDIESDFVERPDSPYSSSRSVGITDAAEGNPGQDHPTNELIRDCHICGYPPCSREDYDLHMKKIHFTHKCHLCIYWSRSPGRLNRHLKDFHGEPTDTAAAATAAAANKKSKNPRKYTCKHCDFYTYAQEEIWKHTRVHVPASKLLSCPHCPFVCAFKHHMQYHMNNHLGHKPFKCSECNYRCNNKSMLNSHRKSHSNDYPYRCGVCNYAAKYRHALNIHLHKKKHLADGEVVLEDQGHRRGGRTRHRGGGGGGGGGGDLVFQNLVSGVGRTPPAAFLPEQMWRQVTQIGSYGRGVKREPDSGGYGGDSVSAAAYPVHAGSSPQPALLSVSDPSSLQELQRCYSPVEIPGRTTSSTMMAAAAAAAAQTRLAAAAVNGAGGYRGVQPPHSPSISPIRRVSSTSLTSAQHHQHHHLLHHHSSVYDISNRRYCFLPPDRSIPPEADNNYRTPNTYANNQEQGYSGCSSEEEWGPLDLTAKPPNPGRTENHFHHHRTSSLDSGGTDSSPRLDWYECRHCGIIFPDRVLYAMHMEYHSASSDPFQCGLCGQRTADRREFFNHISQVAHN